MSTLHTWVEDPEGDASFDRNFSFTAPELILVMRCAGCGGKMALRRDMCDGDVERYAIHEASIREIPGTCEEFIVLEIMDR